MTPIDRLKWNMMVASSGASSAGKAVASALAYRANGGECYPSGGRLASDCGLSERSVWRGVASLVRFGFVEKVGVGGGGANTYRLVFPSGDYDNSVTPDNSDICQNCHSNYDRTVRGTMTELSYKQGREQGSEQGTTKDAPHPTPSADNCPQAKPAESYPQAPSIPPPHSKPDQSPPDNPTPTADTKANTTETCAGSGTNDKGKEGDRPKADNKGKAKKEKWPGPDEAVALWNELAEDCGFKRVRKATKARAAKIKARRSEGMYDEWDALADKMRGIKWLRGDNDRGWVATFDWLIRNDTNWIRLLEGQCDDHETEDEGSEYTLSPGQIEATIAVEDRLAAAGGGELIDELDRFMEG